MSNVIEGRWTEAIPAILHPLCFQTIRAEIGWREYALATAGRLRGPRFRGR